MKDKVRRILIMDPDPSFSGKLSALFSSQGYEVEIVSRVTHAVQRLKEVEFGCVIMDEALPEMKGYDAVPFLKAVSDGSRIIMTAERNSPELESRVRQQDVFFYHLKIFNVNELTAAVRDAFRKTAGKERGLPERRWMNRGKASGRN